MPDPQQIMETFRAAYSTWGYPLVLLGALLENTALLGLVLPGGSVVLLGAITPSGAPWPCPWCLCWAVAGHGAGDEPGLCPGSLGPTLYAGADALDGAAGAEAGRGPALPGAPRGLGACAGPLHRPRPLVRRHHGGREPPALPPFPALRGDRRPGLEPRLGHGWNTWWASTWTRCSASSAARGWPS
jgi:hypothetical protein